MSGPFIVAFDIATITGAADGFSDKKPRCWSWNLKRAGDSRPLKLAMLRDYTDRYLAENRPDAVFYEEGLPLGALFATVARKGVQAAFRLGATDETLGFLRGAIGVVESCAAAARIKRIEAIGVQDARRHLLGPGRVPKGQGKKLVFDRCRLLGWTPKNTDESDALALWSFGCGLTSPLSAHLSTPLFARG